MKRKRTVLGIIALVALAAGLNLLVFLQNVFTPWVLVPLLLGIASGLAWLAASLLERARQSSHEGKGLYGLDTILMSVLFLGICIVLYAFAAHWDRSWDLTQEGRRQLSEQTVQVLRNLNQDVEVLAFFLDIDEELVKIAREKTERFLDQCRQYTPHLKVEFLDPQIDRPRLEALKITHHSTQGTIVLRTGTRQRIVTVAGASPRLEERDFTNSLINVVRSSEPKVYFLTGHGERSVDDADSKVGASEFLKLLATESYGVDRASIMVTKPEVPTDCDVLVINGLGLGGPQSDLHPEEVRAIQEYLDRGGRLLVLIDPWRRVTSGQTESEQLLPWLQERYGIVVGNDMVLSPKVKSPSVAEFSAEIGLFNEKNPQNPFRGCFSIEHPITQQFNQKMLFQAARTVSLAEKMPSGVVGSVLIRTTPDFYAETDLSTLMTTGRAGKSPDERTGPLPVAVAVTAKTEFLTGDTGQTRDARIVVVGDSDFVANEQITVIPGSLNFILDAMAWLCETEELIAIRPTAKEDAPVMLSDFDRRALVYVSVLGTLQAVVAAGLIAYAFRRKYQ